MSELNSYRINTEVGIQDYITLNADLVQDYDAFDILSVSINSDETYRLHNSNYGVVVGRVIANNGFGVPNAKLSIFIEADNMENGIFIPSEDDKTLEVSSVYPFNSSIQKDYNGVRYNLLPDEKVADCHQVVGTFPNKRYALDNDVILEVFDKYYKYTTRTNNSGDYIICGVPTGSHTLHMDLDLSDCGILSQKPRDFVYKGYTVEQFENPNMFKGGTDYSSLSQVFTQDQVVNVNPFWGNDSLGETIGITRADINVAFKFEPTCVFLGCLVSDNSSQGISKRCIPTPHMGDMDELVTGEGRIEMIRKTPGGAVEEFQIKGNELINSDGVWCYQIPMNLDYMMTDEYGNMVPTDNPEKGIPTRARVRFRMSMHDHEENVDNFFRAKVLVPHNPEGQFEGYDYEFGTYTKESSFRDLFWNNVYSVKSYIPRFQKRKNWGWKEEKFTGIKHCNYYGNNNPMPYNNIRIKLPLMFTILCALIKAYIFIVSMLNTINLGLFKILCNIINASGLKNLRAKLVEVLGKIKLIVLKDGLCPDLENWYFAPSRGNAMYSFQGTTKKDVIKNAFQKLADEGGVTLQTDGDLLTYNINLLTRTLITISDDDDTERPESNDNMSIDKENGEEEKFCLTTKTDYLISCVEMALAQEYKVLNFDFYNDWVNGTIYIPRWMRQIKPKLRFLWITWRRQEKVKGCMDDTSIFAETRRYTQQCAIAYTDKSPNGGYYPIFTEIQKPFSNDATNNEIRTANKYHKKTGFKQSMIFGKKGGICHKSTTLKGQNVYYLKPCEFNYANKKVNLFATDIILLGSLNDCDLNGVPKSFKHVTSSSYIMPTNLALTNMETNGPLYAVKDEGTVCNGSTIDMPEISIEDIYTMLQEYCTKVLNELNDDQKATLGITDSTECEEIYGLTVLILNQPEWQLTDAQLALKPILEDIFYECANALETEGMSTKIETQGKTLTSELLYYDSDENGDAKYNKINGENEPTDTIPLTEAAGISWNYTGPGQGEINRKEMYYPGGHFLGLSCVNSQSNIKSCINLMRICEVGADMSQRRESVYDIDEETGKLKMRYNAPSGFISGDDIVDSDFRSMFATMNKKRLIATKVDPTTGYKYYDFDFSSQLNFDGVFGLFASGNSYNQQIEVHDESEELSPFNVLEAALRGDYDPDEENNTQIKTNERTNVDYYLYRLGLSYGDIASVPYQKRKFLESDKTKEFWYLPQFENSFYFYFGLHFGSTAIDEFNKQFFSECDIQSIKKAPGIKLYADVNFCEAVGDIMVVLANLETPYQKIEYVNDLYPTVIYMDENESHYNQEMFTIPNLPFGTYTVTVTDADGIDVSSRISIGFDLIHYDYDVVAFNKPIDENGTSTAGSVFRGGYVSINGLSIDGFEIGDFDNITLKLYDGENVVSTASVTTFGAEYVLYGNKANHDYLLKMSYKCEGMPSQEVVLMGVLFEDNSDIDLKIGIDGIYSRNAATDGNMAYNSDVYWWENGVRISGEGSNGHVNSDNERKWLYRKVFFKETFDTMGSDTFKSEVYSNAEKVYWGSPQNRIGTRNIMCFSRDFGGVPHGYYLDDTATQHATYGKNHCDSAVAPMSGTNERGLGDGDNCVKQYCAQAYDGEKAFGTYKGKKNGNAFSFTSAERGYYKDGYGCVFKPVPHGNLVFLKYSETDDYGDLLNDYDKGVFYPSFIYPVMRRPFYADSVLVKWDGYEFDYNTSSYEFKRKELGGIIEARIHNGVTYNGRFGNLSVNGNDIEDYELMHDLSGLTLSSSSDRILFINNENENMPQSAISLNLVVTEGKPSAAGDYPVATINVDNNKSFARKMFYIAENTENGERIINYYTDGTGDAGINYYIIKAPKNNFDLVSEMDEYYIAVTDEGHSGVFENSACTTSICYVLCRYKYGVVDEVRSMRLFVVRLPEDQPGDGDSAICILYYGPEEQARVHIDWYEDIEGTVNAFLDYIQTLPQTTIWGRIKPVRRVEVNRAPTHPSTGETFYNYFARLQQRAYLVNNRYLTTHNCIYNKESDILLGIGVYDDGSEMGNNKVYMIYNMIARNYSNIGDPGWEFYFENNDSNDGNVYHNECSSTFELPLTIVVENDCELGFAKDPSATWVGLTYENGDPINTNVVCTAGQGFNFVVKCHYNDENSPRNTSISVSTVGGFITKTINITQTAAPNGNPLTIGCSAYTTNIQGITTHYLKMSADCIDSDVVKVSVTYGYYTNEVHSGEETEILYKEHTFDSQNITWEVAKIVCEPDETLDARLWFESVEITELWSCRKLRVVYYGS